MKSFRKPCVARMEEPHKQATMQRHTISGEKSCVVTRGRTRRRETMQRHTFLIRKACVADRDQVRRRWFVQRHTISREKTCVASTDREKKRTEATPHCTTRYDHPTKQNHNTSYHIISQPYPNPTTLPTDKTPYHASNTIHYNTIQQKPFLPQNWRKSFINLSANRLS